MRSSSHQVVIARTRASGMKMVFKYPNSAPLFPKPWCSWLVVQAARDAIRFSWYWGTFIVSYSGVYSSSLFFLSIIRNRECEVVKLTPFSLRINGKSDSVCTYVPNVLDLPGFCHSSANRRNNSGESRVSIPYHPPPARL